MVLVVTRADRIGGAQVHVLDLARGLRARGVPTVVITGPPGPFTTALEQAGIPHRSLPHLVRPVRPLADLRALLALCSVLRQLNPALVAAHSTKATWLARLAAASLGIPCVITVHGWPWATPRTTPGRVTRNATGRRGTARRGTARRGTARRGTARTGRGSTRMRSEGRRTTAIRTRGIRKRGIQTMRIRARAAEAGQGRPAPRRSRLRRLRYAGAQDGAGHRSEAVTLAVARWGERLLARLAAAVITVSGHDYREGLRHGLVDPRRAVVIPNGVADPAAGRGEGCGGTGGTGGSGGNGGTGRNGGLQATGRLPAQVRWAGQDGAAGPLRVVMVARFEPPKDHATLLQAVALLEEGSLGSPGPVPNCVPNWVVELAGDGPLLPGAVKLARTLGIGHRVRFLGAQPDGAGAVQDAAVAVLCSQREGLPLAVLEAMAAGVPVVASAVGGVPEAVRPGVTGYLVPPGDPAALAHCLRLLLADPILRQRMGAAARARYESRFTVDRMVEATLAVYRRVCGGSS
ncbi:glycosyltransferase family 4 protein [Thermaerobacter sp. PB12/4term]|nr:glycosyltransferase family 4 protein [Thermaerobacter sp. PB12/4term]